MKRRISFRLVAIAVCLIAISQVGQAQRTSQRVNGTVVGISGRSAGRTFPFSLIINGYTSPGQVTELNQARQRGEDELLNALSKMNQGRIQIGNSVGVDANAIIVVPWENGGTKITVLYQRNLAFFELRYGTRSRDYRFGYAEMYLDANGKGQGTLIPAAKVDLENGDQWVVEDFGVFPARLMGLRSTGRLLPR